MLFLLNRKNKTQNEIVISGLDPFTMYEFDMCSFTSDSVGPYCDARAARTLEDRKLKVLGTRN